MHKNMCSFLGLFILIGILSVCEGPEEMCRVLAKHQYVEVGSDVEVACYSSCVSDSVFWTLNKERVSNRLSHTINSSYTVLLLKNMTLSSAMLQCHGAHTEYVLGGAVIRTYTKPAKIMCTLHFQNLTAISNPDVLNCSWEHKMNSPPEIKYTLYMKCATCLSTSFQSGSCSSSDTWCTVVGRFSLSNNITVTVRAKSAVWEVYSDIYEFHPYYIFKINPPQIEVTATSSHLRVEWKRLLHAAMIHCQVKYSKVTSQGAEVRVFNKTLKPREDGNVTIEKVESCKSYKVSVQCGLDKAPQSDWSHEKAVLSELNENEVNLHLWRKVTKPSEKGIRTVHVMWTEIPPTCQGNFKYTIKQSPYKEGKNVMKYSQTLCGTSSCDVTRDAHRITLTALRNGVPLAEDSVYVPAIGRLKLPQVSDIQTWSHEGVIVINWKAPDQRVSGYMIDWTHNGKQYYWKETEHTNTTLFALLNQTPYNITVTPLFEDKTGHGMEALQICSGLGGPGNISYISVEATDRSARLSWKMESHACNGVIHYIVFYGTYNGPMFSVIVNTTEWDVLLDDLTPNTQYVVYVKIIGLTATTTSKERFFNTSRFGLTLLKDITIHGGCPSFVLLLGLCGAYQWKKFLEKAVPDPALSSVASWPFPNHREMLQSFSGSAESLDVYERFTPTWTTLQQRPLLCHLQALMVIHIWA
ncbi:interleukin-6 receptor subunit beta-like [Thalassophryne amazonica]|uniref:interleukin-6 receptor subunit beta-like n=1 Tax=Thalassophryne amazonica TaxID=390379 RepID=UPI0014716390|nr:interleukin-6 receptor subunit beta-like [Thalassophryne amazonica]